MKLALAAAAFAVASVPAAAHIGLKPNQAQAGSEQTLSFVVEHGCDGSPTIRLRVRMPDGAEEVRAHPKNGWRESASRSNASSTRVDEVVWIGGKLDSRQLGDFAVSLRLPDTPGATLYFPVVQECEKGVMRWIEVPGPNMPPGPLKSPAPRFNILGKAP